MKNFKIKTNDSEYNLVWTDLDSTESLVNTFKTIKNLSIQNKETFNFIDCIYGREKKISFAKVVFCLFSDQTIELDEFLTKINDDFLKDCFLR